MSQDFIVGIDLGTTNSLIGVVDSGFPILLADEEGQRLTPSAVYYPPGGGEPAVGRAALRRRGAEPGRVVTSVKRLIGWRGGEVDLRALPYPAGADAAGEIRVLPGEEGADATPAEVSACILRRLKAVAEARMEAPVRRAVITVPAYFNDAQRKATIRAGELAGLQVERIVNEPTAAALAYGIDRKGDRAKIAVFDLGGGTFDISILELNDGVFQVLATCGDTQLGGDDIDEALAESLWDSGPAAAHGRPGARCSGTRPRGVSRCHRWAKERSNKDAAEVRPRFSSAPTALKPRSGAAEFERLAAPSRRARPHCSVVALADVLRARRPDEVILWRSTRLPAVRGWPAADSRASEPLKPTRRSRSARRSKAASYPARATRSLLDGHAALARHRDIRRLMNASSSRATRRSRRRQSHQRTANQPAMAIRILQGEREMARDNWEPWLARKSRSPRGAKGARPCRRPPEIDANGALTVPQPRYRHRRGPANRDRQRGGRCR
ncbi:MAG: Hsp70 family protein [Verrucomicrobiales bacterium]